MAESGSEKSGGRGVPDGLKEAIEGAFAATGKTRAQAQDLTEKTRNRAQGLVDEVTRRGSDARGRSTGFAWSAAMRCASWRRESTRFPVG